MRHEDARITYERYALALEGEPRPCALVDLDAFERNAELLLQIATHAGKSLRVATKSVRCPELLRRIEAKASAGDRGPVSFMTYTARETAFLRTEGFDDFLLAYPVVSRVDADILAALVRDGTTLSVVVDDRAHLEVLDAAARSAQMRLKVVVEVDMAFRPVGSVHLGVRRSPLRDLHQVLAFVDTIDRFESLSFVGVMGYEAQIAGLGDDFPTERAKSAFVRTLRALSRRDVEESRANLVFALTARGKRPALVNGGGTGNLTWCSHEPALTEVTAGSGFLCSHLFDRYRDVRPEPAAYFCLDVVRRPGPGLVTCAGGGYVASGAIGEDRLPIPALPKGCSLLGLEGAGEVQTPLRVPAFSEIRVGEPVFFRHAKAGELAEHFPEYLLVRGDAVEGRAKTYRGLGHSFLG
jgi:D-serine deaminase-like pyridoxal phosphate-dependent protein